MTLSFSTAAYQCSHLTVRLPTCENSCNFATYICRCNSDLQQPGQRTVRIFRGADQRQPVSRPPRWPHRCGANPGPVRRHHGIFRGRHRCRNFACRGRAATICELQVRHLLQRGASAGPRPSSGWHRQVSGSGQGWSVNTCTYGAHLLARKRHKQHHRPRAVAP